MKLRFPGLDSGQKGPRIVYDTISIGASVIAVVIALFLFTFDKAVIALFPTVLLLSGLVLYKFVSHKLEVDQDISGKEAKTIGWYTLVALVVAGLAAAVSPLLVVVIPQAILDDPNSVILYVQLMAVSEEVFFRGFITQFTVSKLGSGPGIILSALIFSLFHLAVYGTDLGLLVYIFVSGVGLSFAVVASRRLSPAIMAHMLVNLVASI